MKTVAVYWYTEGVKYILLDGDQSRFDGVYINVHEGALAVELCELLYDYDNGGAPKYPEITLAEFKEHVHNGAHVIEIGFAW